MIDIKKLFKNYIIVTIIMTTALVNNPGDISSLNSDDNNKDVLNRIEYKWIAKDWIGFIKLNGAKTQKLILYLLFWFSFGCVCAGGVKPGNFD